jgi:hypothetical protein
MGDVVQAVSVTSCNRWTPEHWPSKTALCSAVGIAGHVIGDLVSPLIAKKAGDVVVNISQEGKVRSEVSSDDDGYLHMLAEIAGGWIGQHMAKAPCHMLTAPLAGPVGTVAGFACEAVASYVGSYVAGKTINVAV